MVLQWEAAYAKAYQIQVSVDAASWTSIYSTTMGQGLRETLTVDGVVAMYAVRHRAGDHYGYSLWEFEVYGTGGSPSRRPRPRRM